MIAKDLANFLGLCKFYGMDLPIGINRFFQLTPCETLWCRLRFVVAAALLVPVCSSAAWTQTADTSMDTTAKAAIVTDMTSGTVLMAKNADLSLPPASMSKLMTLYLLFDALKDRRVDLTTMFQVSEKAAKMGGSTMFLSAGENVSVDDLIRGVIVQSGNDACIAIAENLAGTEEAFVRFMNLKAEELGLENSTFANSTGWPHPAHMMSATDLIELAKRIIEDFPQYYGYFKEPEFTWGGVTQSNRNPLLGLGAHVDGLKTGHTNAAGYGLVGSADNGVRRILFVVSGLESEAERQRESLRLVNWAFREFSIVKVFESDTQVAQARVSLGSQNRVGLVTAGEVLVTSPFWAKDDMTVSLRYQDPLEAPIEKGSHVADLLVKFPGMPTSVYPLLAETSVERGGVISRVSAVFEIMWIGVSSLVLGTI